ncbi:hypothetical protein HanXRQr2_Chr08g0324231 [Helianthus annuus]|uniref:Uncharacterized protein n=1 Tax=Helianthus annuus TaxID=4232 RepID=A0A251U2I2_HELAN|nr:hypothetical protein HanXRQr2_Chr08g0324231 [Helianthus annuus]
MFAPRESRRGSRQWRTQELFSWGAKFKGVFYLLLYNTYLVRFGSGRKNLLANVARKASDRGRSKNLFQYSRYFWMLNFIESFKQFKSLLTSGVTSRRKNPVTHISFCN